MIYPPGTAEKSGNGGKSGGDASGGGASGVTTAVPIAPSNLVRSNRLAVAPSEPLPAGYDVYRDCMGSCFCLCERADMPEIQVAKQFG